MVTTMCHESIFCFMFFFSIVFPLKKLGFLGLVSERTGGKKKEKGKTMLFSLFYKQGLFYK